MSDLLTPDDISPLKVSQLRSELKKRGLPQSGVKKALQERLLQSLSAADTDEEDDVPEPDFEDLEDDLDKELLGSGDDVADNTTDTNVLPTETETIDTEAGTDEGLDALLRDENEHDESVSKQPDNTVTDHDTDAQTEDTSATTAVPKKKTQSTTIPDTFSSRPTIKENLGLSDIELALKKQERLARFGTQVLTAAEKIELRQQRFAQKSKSGAPAIDGSLQSVLPKDKSDGSGLTFEKLKERQKRFGTTATANGESSTANGAANVTSHLSAEEKQKITDRMKRFGTDPSTAVQSTSADGDAKLAARMMRFGKAARQSDRSTAMDRGRDKDFRRNQRGGFRGGRNRGRGGRGGNRRDRSRDRRGGRGGNRRNNFGRREGNSDGNNSGSNNANRGDRDRQIEKISDFPDYEDDNIDDPDKIEARRAKFGAF